MNDQQLITDAVESPEYIQAGEMLEELLLIRQQNAAILQSLRTLEQRGNGHHFNAKVVDINMPFQSMIGLMMKVVLASIPALILLFILAAAASVFLGGFFASMIGG